MVLQGSQLNCLFGDHLFFLANFLYNQILFFPFSPRRRHKSLSSRISIRHVGWRRLVGGAWPGVCGNSWSFWAEPCEMCCKWGRASIRGLLRWVCQVDKDMEWHRCFAAARVTIVVDVDRSLLAVMHRSSPAHDQECGLAVLQLLVPVAQRA